MKLPKVDEISSVEVEVDDPVGLYIAFPVLIVDNSVTSVPTDD